MSHPARDENEYNRKRRLASASGSPTFFKGRAEAKRPGSTSASRGKVCPARDENECNRKRRLASASGPPTFCCSGCPEGRGPWGPPQGDLGGTHTLLIIPPRTSIIILNAMMGTSKRKAYAFREPVGGANRCGRRRPNGSRSRDEERGLKPAGMHPRIASALRSQRLVYGASQSPVLRRTGESGWHHGPSSLADEGPFLRPFGHQSI